MTDVHRRSVIEAGIATVGIGTLAGCSGSSDGGDGSDGSDSGDGSDGSDGSGSSGGSADRELDIAATFGQDHPQVQLLNRWGENLQEQTDGSLGLNYVSLGGEEDHISATSSGSIAGHGVAMPALTQSYGTEYGFLEAPFVVQDWEHFLALMDEYVYGDDGFNSQLIDQANQRILGSAFRGLRGTNANKAIKTPENVQDLSMRLPEFDTWVQSWEEIGAAATPVPYDELYQALQTGTVNSSEGPIAQFVDASLYEVQTHFAQTDHLLSTQNWVINEGTWQDLSDDQQQAMQDSLDEAIEWANEESRSAAEELITMVQEEYDITVISRDEVDQEAFRSAARPQLEEFFAERWEPSLEDVESLA